MRDAYETVVHWRRNSFLIPSGKAGIGFVMELARLYQAYADDSALHSIAFTACCVFQVLLLQKPHAKSKSRSMWPAWNVVFSYGIMVIFLHYLMKESVFRIIFNPPFSLGLNLETMLESLII